MQLTKEYFEEYLDKRLNERFQAQALDFNILIDSKLKAQTEDLKKFTIEQTKELVRMVGAGFDHVDSELKIIIQRLDITDKIKEIDRKFGKLENVLNIEL